MRKYAYQKSEEGIVKVLGKEVTVSRKRSYEVARTIRGMQVQKAKNLLNDVLVKKRAIPYAKHNRKIPHRPGIGPGRYPEKASKIFLGLLKELEANAEFKGMNAEDLKIEHTAVHKAGVIRGSYKGSRQYTPLTHIELIAKEVEGKETQEPKGAGPSGSKIRSETEKKLEKAEKRAEPKKEEKKEEPKKKEEKEEKKAESAKKEEPKKAEVKEKKPEKKEKPKEEPEKKTEEKMTEKKGGSEKAA